MDELVQNQDNKEQEDFEDPGKDYHGLMEKDKGDREDQGNQFGPLGPGTSVIRIR